MSRWSYEEQLNILKALNNPAEVSQAFKEAGISRSAGYRLLKQLRGMSATDAKAFLLRDELARGTHPPDAFKKIGVSRATGYRLLKRIIRVRQQSPRTPDLIDRLMLSIVEAIPAMPLAEQLDIEMDMRAECGGKRVYVQVAKQADRRRRKR